MHGHGRTLSSRSILASVGTLCVVLLIPSPASALSHPFLETFGSANEPSFSQPLGLAIDQSTGDLLAIDGEANTVSRWNSDGTPDNFSALGTNVIDGGGGGADETPEGELAFGSAGEVQVAVDSSGGPNDGNIYVPQAGARVVDVFGEDGTFLGQLTESNGGGFVEPCGVAVDSSGNVYVGDFSGAIHKYEPAGSPPENGDNTANLPFSGNCTLAAGAGPTEGFLFAAHFEGSVAKLDSTTGEEKYTVVAGLTRAISVDPSTGHLFRTRLEEIGEFDASGASSATEVSSTPLASGAFGVAVNGSTGRLYAARAGETHVEVYALPPSGPPSFELNVQKTGDGSGTVTSTPPGIDCGSECGAEFEEGEEVELEATPAAGSEFTGWTAAAGDPGTCAGTSSPCTVAMSEAVELEAEFVLLDAPSITALSPTRGPSAGGNLVTIAGTHLSEAAKVEFGETVVDDSEFAENTDTTIKLNAPAHLAGTVNVIVTTIGGPSANTATDDYTYVGCSGHHRSQPDQSPPCRGR